MDIPEIMENMICKTKNLELELSKDRKIEILNGDLTDVIGKTIDKAANYVIKAMPVPDAIKDILLDVKEAIKTKDLKRILETTVKSTVREGLELLGVSSSNIKDITDLKNIALKGGLITGVKNAIQIVANNYLKNNIVGKYVYSFFERLKEYILSNKFKEKLNKRIDLLMNRKNDFMNRCEQWYDAYKKLDINEINIISEKLASSKYVLNRYEECARENKIIQNITEMINNKKAYLTQNQTRLCEVI